MMSLELGVSGVVALPGSSPFSLGFSKYAQPKKDEMYEMPSAH